MVRLAIAASLVLVSACASSVPGSSAAVEADGPRRMPLTRERQVAITPDEALRMLRAGNERFVAGSPAYRNEYLDLKATRDGAYPFAAVLTCTDARTSPERVFDQGIGDIVAVRVAGNVVDADVLGSLEYAVAFAGVKLIVVLGHDGCDAVRQACAGDGREDADGQLREALGAALARADSADIVQRSEPGFVSRVERENVYLSVRRVLARSPSIRERVRSGRVAVIGAMLDGGTGVVRFEP